MTMNTIDRFFLNEQEVSDFAVKNGIGGIGGMLRSANEGDGISTGSAASRGARWAICSYRVCTGS